MDNPVKFDNTEILFQSFIREHPDLEHDLRRLIKRVVMDVRNNFNSMASDIEMAIEKIPAKE